MKGIGPVCIFQDRPSHALFAKQSRELGECFVQPVRVAQGRLEKMKLLPPRPGGFGGQGNGHDWMFRPKRFEMGLEEAEQNLHGVGRVGDVKAMRVVRLVGKSEPEGHLPGDEVERTEA